MHSIAFAWIAVFLSLASSLHAAPGDLDPTFGVGGYTGRNGGIYPSGGGIGSALDAAGGVLVVGSNVIQRFTPTGAPDQSWGTNGIVTVQPSGPTVSFYAVAIQPDGKVVAAGSYVLANPPDSFVVVRCASDGTLDASFGAGGIVTTTAGYSAVARSVAIQPDGKILVGGIVQPGEFSDTAAVARYLPDGSLDPSFGSGGIVMAHTPGPGYDGRPESALMLHLQPDGSIVGAGAAGVARWLADGTADTTFGSGGFVAVPANFAFGSGDDALALSPDGKLLLGGYNLRRLNADGSLDGGFGTGGIVHFVDGSFERRVSAVTLQGDGKILVGLGQEQVNTLAIARVLPSGMLDPTFGGGGIAALLMDSVAASGPNHVAARSDGLIVATTPSFSTAFLGGDCGNGTVERGEDCDDGNVADGDGCDAHCCVADADGDGRCDAFDACPLGVPVTKATMSFSADSTKFSAVVDAVLPVPFAPALNPLLHGIRVVVAGSGSSAPIDFVVPGGTYDDVTASGWSASSTGTRWKWHDGAQGLNFVYATFPGNVFKVSVQDRSLRTPGLVHISAQGRTRQHGFYAPYATLRHDLPLRLGIMLDAHVAQGRQCAEIDFVGSPPSAPYCAINARNDKTTCKTP